MGCLDRFADGYEGVTVAGLAIVAADSGKVLLAQRAWDETDAPDVQETWEFVGGHLNPGEDPQAAALREYEEEIGEPAPAGEVVNGWRAGPDGHYQGFIYVTPEVVDFASWSSTDEVQNVGWFSREEAMALDNLRPEVRESEAWDLIDQVSGNEERKMTEAAVETEPEWDALAFAAQPIPVHGVIAPEEIPTGDGRGFNAGSMTRRPLRLPLSDQHVAIGGHDGSVVTGSVDRMMRKDGLIHWEGALMPSPDTERLVERMVFFDGRYGVSVDGDNGSLDRERSQSSGQMWFEAVRASGLTAVSIPAFHEAYIAFGLHPDMPDDDTDAVLAASGLANNDIIGGRMEFKRGPGWVTNPEDTRRLHAYWTQPGQPGYEKIGWGTPGDFARAKALIGEKIAANSPEDMRFLNQIIAQWHFDALGYWPATHAKMDRAGAKAAAAARGIFNLSEDGSEWEAVLAASLTSSTVDRPLPPLSYFDRHPDTGAMAIDDPDENGLRRCYGYVAEWGVCHIGIDNRCVEPPRPPDGQFPDFHLGRTKARAEDGSAVYLNTGVMTYLVNHRDAETILSETAEQQHFDNVANAWSAVRLGVDDRGIWASGVVLPGIPDEDCVLIEATGQVSGEWKYGSLRAVQSVNVPGYPVQRASAAFDDEGNVTALVAITTGRDLALVASANGVVDSECYDKGGENSPKARMQALAKADAEERMNRLRGSVDWADLAGKIGN